MISNSEIRAKARQSLGGLFQNSFLIPVLIVLAAGAIISALSATVIGSLIASGLVSIGVAAYFLMRVRGGEANNFACIIDGAKVDIVGNILTGILHSLFITLWSMLFVIPGIIKACSYSMTFFIKLEHPEYTANQAITESRKMMKGHKMQYFLLQLSFIGWYILGALCLGVGVLWVDAYAQTATAVFYEELKAKTEPKKAPEAEEAAE